MKLSEAIKLGSMLRPQSHGDLYETRDRPLHQNGVLGLVVKERVASCALGAAFEAGGIGTRMATEEEARQDAGKPFRGVHNPNAPTQYYLVPREWNVLLHSETACPQCGHEDTLNRIIPHLNDGHEWKREAIALFVEQIERATAPAETPGVPIKVSA